MAIGDIDAYTACQGRHRCCQKPSWFLCPNSGIYEPMRGSVMVWDTL